MPFFLYVEMQLNCSLVYWVIVFVFLGGGGGLLDFFSLVCISYDFWPHDCFVLVFQDPQLKFGIYTHSLYNSFTHDFIISLTVKIISLICCIFI